MLRINKNVKEEQIKEVLNALVEHHDILRAIYYDGQLEILSKENSRLYDYELISLVGDHIKEQLEEQCTKIQQSIDLRKGPLMKIALFQILEERFLLIVVHHLVIDGVSWRIFIDDFYMGLSQVEEGRRITLPQKTASFKAWSEALADYKTSGLLKKEIIFWKKMIEEAPKGRLDVEVYCDRGGYENIDIEFSLLETKELLQNTRKAFRTEINDLLVSALGMAVYKVMGKEVLTVNLEGHGREAIHKKINVDRTIGWFTSIYPIVICCTDCVEEAIISTKDKLRSIPNHGLGYGLLKENLPEIQVDLYFNFLGEMNIKANEKPIPYSCGKNVAPENKINGIINFNGIIMQGKLKFVLTYSRENMTDKKMKQLALAYKKCLNEIVMYCKMQENTKKTLTDYTVKNLNADDISNINLLLQDIKK